MSENYWRRQVFKLVYILFFAFVFPALVIGFFALVLLVYEPQTLFKNRPRGPQRAVHPLESPTWFVRQEALDKLAARPADRSRRDIVEKVKPLLRDSNFQIQDTAIKVLGDWGSPEDAQALRDLAADPSGVFVRPQVCAALGKIGGEPSCEALVDILGMGDSEREQAIAALEKGGPAAEEVLLRRGATAEPANKRAICLALAKIGTEKSREFLTTASADVDQTVADAAKGALKRSP